MRVKQEEKQGTLMEAVNKKPKATAYAIQPAGEGLYHLVKYEIEGDRIVDTRRNEPDVREIQLAKASAIMEGFLNVNFR